MVNILKIYKNFRYPKLFLLFLSTILAILLFNTFFFKHFIVTLNEYVFLGIFLAGFLLSIGLTIPFAVAFFVLLAKATTTNLIDATLVGGFGALVGNILLFELTRYNLMDKETRKVSYHSFKAYNQIFGESLLFQFKSYLSVVFAGIIIMSPTSNEMSTKMLAGFTEIDRRVFYLTSFIINSIIILTILLLSII